MTDSEIKIEGFKALANRLGIVEAERFVTLILREPFDYTTWHRNLFEDMTLEEISTAAMNHENRQAENKGRMTDA